LFLLLRKANPNVALHAIEDALACEQLNGIETNLGIKLVDSLRDCDYPQKLDKHIRWIAVV